MNIFKRFYCRVYQFVLKLAMPFLPYREPQILKGVESVYLELNKNKIERVLLVTGPTLRAKKITEPLENSLLNNGIKCFVYYKTEPNPTVDNIEEAYKMYLDNGCQAIIGFGGGSNIDCAKVVGARVVRPNKSVRKLKGLMKVGKKLPLTIAIPTTAGSGSEATLSAVVTDKQLQEKYTINSFALIPDFAVLDASLLKTLPPYLIATTGMDALTHSIEAFIGRSTNKKVREYCLQSVKKIYQNLLDVYNDKNNDLARENMLKASYLSGLAFSRAYVGYVHALSHSLSAKYNYSHGETNAILLPYVLKKYGKTVEKRLYRLACEVGLDKNGDIESGANNFILEIENLNSKMGIPNKIDIDIKDLDFLITHTSKEANPLYPVPKLLDKKELKEIYLQVKK